jgi:hypothetical protein
LTYATTKCRFAFEKNVKTREKVVESEMNSTRSLLSLAVFFTLGASHQVEVRTDPSTEASFPVGSEVNILIGKYRGCTGEVLRLRPKNKRPISVKRDCSKHPEFKALQRGHGKKYWYEENDLAPMAPPAGEPEGDSSEDMDGGDEKESPSPKPEDKPMDVEPIKPNTRKPRGGRVGG